MLDFGEEEDGSAGVNVDDVDDFGDSDDSSDGSDGVCWRRASVMNIQTMGCCKDNAWINARWS